MQHCIGIPYGAHSLHCGTPCIEQISLPWGVRKCILNALCLMILKIADQIPLLDGHQQWSWKLLSEYLCWMATNNDLEHCWPNTFTGWPTTMILNIVDRIPVLDCHQQWSWTLLTEYLYWMSYNNDLETKFFFCRNGGTSDWRGVSRNIIWKNLW